MNSKTNNGGIRELNVVQVIQTYTAVGKGVTGDPIRMVREYWTMDGQLIASSDFPMLREGDFDGKEETP